MSVAKKMGGSSPCASCKLLRRRCTKDCIFAPYFPADDPQRFANVHKVFGASNVGKMLQEVGVEKRADAVSSMVFEANARIRDPIYGCVGAISYLQKQVTHLQMQLAMAEAQIVSIKMQQDDPSMVLIQNQLTVTDDYDVMPSNVHDYLSFAALTSEEIQDPFKRESLWT
ncbi:hypothetical protein RND81_01G119400 [Saponaria officinalis]|uniref:LOB domain-containing protein n=1 Tax=Saponaria officinalis TaxID=3572 RepID=A0AAW1NDR0_SAPOF